MREERGGSCLQRKRGGSYSAWGLGKRGVVVAWGCGGEVGEEREQRGVTLVVALLARNK